MTFLQAVACLILGVTLYDELRAALHGRRGVRSVVFLAVACVAFALACPDGGNPVDLTVYLVALGLWTADVLAALFADLL